MAPTLNQDDIKLLKGIFATKEDLKDFAKKDDLKNFATKNDLSSMEERFGKKFATKEDVKMIIKMSEMRIIKRMDEMDNFLDRETVRLAKDIDKLKPSSVQYT